MNSQEGSHSMDFEVLQVDGNLTICFFFQVQSEFQEAYEKGIHKSK